MSYFVNAGDGFETYDTEQEANVGPPSLEDMIGTLDERYGNTWSLQRSMMNRKWFVVIQARNQHVLPDTVTIRESLEYAVGYTVLPLIPRAPKLEDPSEYAVRKSGTKWEVTRKGQTYCGNLKTKQLAESAISNFIRHTQERYDEWEKCCGETVANGTEGVDFAYRT